MADMWINGFGLNMVCFDRHAKEFVKVTNGRCQLDHSSPAAFKAAHDAHAEKTGQHGCLYAPCEAIALRCVGVIGQGDPVVAFTCRVVNPADLSPAKETAFPDMTRFRKSRFVGRV